MRLARLSPTLQGKMLGTTILAPDGSPLLTAGTRLTLPYIRSLQRKGYRFIHIDDEFSSGIDSDEALEPAARARVLEAIKLTLKDIAAQRPLDSKRVVGAVEDIVESIRSRAGVALSVATLRSLDEYTYVHSLNVCVLALTIGIESGLSRPDLIDLGVGAMLHDIGKAIVPLDVLNKPRKLTPQEMAIMKLHAVEGFEILRKQEGVSLLSAHVAFQHHERMDGEGYPRGLPGEEIHSFARMTAVADVMDALTAPRPYRKGLMPDRAREIVSSLSGTHLDPKYVRVLVHRVCLFPAGVAVRLSTGEIGIVCRQSSLDPARPVIRVLTDSSQRPVEPYELSLVFRPSVAIVELLYDVPQPVQASFAGDK